MFVKNSVDLDDFRHGVIGGLMTSTVLTLLISNDNMQNLGLSFGG